MPRLHIPLLAAAAYLLPVQVAVPATYWVDQSQEHAADANPGTEDRPWLTIGKAARTLGAGDTVIVRRCETANDGDIVVALIDNEEATLKRFHQRVGGQIELAPENRSLRPLVIDARRVRIQGVLVSQMRTYS